MRGTTKMPQLTKDATSRLMNSVGNFPPSSNMLISVDSRSIRPFSSLLANEHTFAQDEPGAAFSTLPVIFLKDFQKLISVI
jgi:hypothetical protein